MRSVSALRVLCGIVVSLLTSCAVVCQSPQLTCPCPVEQPRGGRTGSASGSDGRSRSERPSPIELEGAYFGWTSIDRVLTASVQLHISRDQHFVISSREIRAAGSGFAKEYLPYSAGVVEIVNGEISLIESSRWGSPAPKATRTRVTRGPSSLLFTMDWSDAPKERTLDRAPRRSATVEVERLDRHDSKIEMQAILRFDATPSDAILSELEGVLQRLQSCFHFFDHERSLSLWIEVDQADTGRALLHEVDSLRPFIVRP